MAAYQRPRPPPLLHPYAFPAAHPPRHHDTAPAPPGSPVASTQSMDGSGYRGEIVVKGNAGCLRVLNWGDTIVIEGDTTLPGGEMKSGTIFVKGKVLDMLPSYKDEGTEEVDGFTYRMYTGDLSCNGECYCT